MDFAQLVPVVPVMSKLACARESFDFFSSDDSDDSSSARFTIHVTGSKPWKIEVCILLSARSG
jgi:hypothetical protein